MHPRKRVALPHFWEYLEKELDELLGGNRLDDVRRHLGAGDSSSHDCEGTQWFESGLDRVEGDG